MQGQFVVGVQQIEREGSSWTIEGRRVPGLAKELLVSFEMPALAAAAVEQLKMVDAVHIHNDERVVEDLRGRTRSV